MEHPYTLIRYITDQSKGISIRARVNMLWHVPINPHSLISDGLHLILMDAMGDSIEATVKGPHVHFFLRTLHEGSVYEFSAFSVVKYLENYRATNHPYKLEFQFSTIFHEVTCAAFPCWSLNNNSVDDVSVFKNKSTHLMGLFFFSL
ncbi:hypothetical protein RIF29_39164 [Crotalaria pallida]|uniref:Replication protein A 70 kDa DNA-binding subunit B/D first OB fold domain-containing protein n=1 Tax=Crotalaria pallida TaxID=3830 RepID=A0AAN9E174_CROPI